MPTPRRARSAELTIAVLVLVSAGCIGCESPTRHSSLPTEIPVSPPTADPTPIPAPAPTAIELGATISAIVTGATNCADAAHCLPFVLTPPASGTLVVHLTWDIEYYGCFLEVSFKDGSSAKGFPPIELRHPVSAGQPQRIQIKLAGCDMFLHQPFTMTTALQ